MKYPRTNEAYEKSWRDDADRVNTLVAECEKMKDEIDELENEIIGWRNKWNCAIEMGARAENARDEMTLRWERTNDALFAERTLADRLATALRSTHWHRQAALDAWKEVRK